MKINQSLLYEVNTGIVNNLDKYKYIDLIQKYFNVFSNVSVAKSKSYDEIIKELQKKTDVLNESKGIYICNTQKDNIKLVCLLDTTQEEFNSYCKKKGWAIKGPNTIQPPNLLPVIQVTPEMFTGVIYPGSSNNRQILYDNEFYMVKYTKIVHRHNKKLTDDRQTAIMEYIGSTLLKLYGVNVQEVKLGWDTEKNQYCVLCKDFIANSPERLSLILLNQESSRDVVEQKKRKYCINDIELYLKSKLLPRYVRNGLDIQEAVEQWVLLTVTDFLIINKDRHIGNIGYISNLKNKTMIPSPIFDNGASFCSLLHIDNYFSEKELIQKVKPLYSLLQLYNGVQVNYQNAVEHKLPQVFYNKMKEVFGKFDKPLGLDIFDKLYSLPNMSQSSKNHIKASKIIYIHNFALIKKCIEEN